MLATILYHMLFFHIQGEDDEEVRFKDLAEGVKKNEASYPILQFTLFYFPLSPA
jgi:hypothetical protein